VSDAWVVGEVEDGGDVFFELEEEFCEGGGVEI